MRPAPAARTTVFSYRRERRTGRGTGIGWPKLGKPTGLGGVSSSAARAHSFRMRRLNDHRGAALRDIVKRRLRKLILSS